MVVHGDASIASLLADRGVHRRLRAHETVFRQGDPTTSVYECLSGRLRLVSSAAGGREVLLDVVLPGEVFGQWSAFDAGPRHSSAVSMEPSWVSELPARVFLEAVRHQPELALGALRALVFQLRVANDRICADETEQVSVRIARLLVQLGERFAPGHESSADIAIPLNQQQVAEWIGASREAASRALGRLRRDGVISTGRSVITIHDHERLASAASMWTTGRE